MTVTQTQKALNKLTEWGKNPNSYGGENIAFGLVRQGDPGDAFLASGDCTPFTPKGNRGVLNGQPSGDTGAPVATFPFATPEEVPFTFSFNLNAGEVTLNGTFPDLPTKLDFTVEYIKEYLDDGGANISFHSEKTSDNAGYIIVLQHVAASG
ncbi:MAG TPA: hypothetical protein VMC78_19995 [Mycobacterium sp.]|nr:hypothetical protein [Mycobacterium sp.]